MPCCYEPNPIFIESKCRSNRIGVRRMVIATPDQESEFKTGPRPEGDKGPLVGAKCFREWGEVAPLAVLKTAKKFRDG